MSMITFPSSFKRRKIDNLKTLFNIDPPRDLDLEARQLEALIIAKFKQANRFGEDLLPFGKMEPVETENDSDDDEALEDTDETESNVEDEDDDDNILEGEPASVGNNAEYEAEEDDSAMEQSTTVDEDSERPV